MRKRVAHAKQIYDGKIVGGVLLSPGNRYVEFGNSSVTQLVQHYKEHIADDEIHHVLALFVRKLFQSRLVFEGARKLVDAILRRRRGWRRLRENCLGVERDSDHERRAPSQQAAGDRIHEVSSPFF